MTKATGTTVLEGGRRKAFRPLPVTARREALRAGLAAYDRRDFFLAHELLEPAWMGSDDPVERALEQGLIKLAAAGVHAVRANRMGVAKNLAGARERLTIAADSGISARISPEVDAGIDLQALIAAIDDRLAADVAPSASGLSTDDEVVPDPPRLPRRG